MEAASLNEKVTKRSEVYKSVYKNKIAILVHTTSTFVQNNKNYSKTGVKRPLKNRQNKRS